MSLFKNKYCKIFPLTIFITQCSDSEEEDGEETKEIVTFKKENQLQIYKSYIYFNKENNILEEKDDLLFQNDEDYTVNKYFKKTEDIITNALYDPDNKEYTKKNIIEFLNSYEYCSYIVYEQVKEEKKNLNNYKLKDDGFNKDLYFYLYFYKKLNEKIKLSNKTNQELNLVQNKITTKDITKNIDNINKINSYKNKIYEIIKIFYPEIKSSANKIISINGKKVNKNTQNNKSIFENFIKELDEDDKVINIVLDDYYNIEVSDIILSDNLTKIYKISNDKKNEIKECLNGDYNNFKYSSLQFELSKEYKDVKIENGNNDKEIPDIKNVTITIIEDKNKDNDKSKNRVIIPKECTIEFKAKTGLFIIDDKKYGSKKIKFSNSEGEITTDTVIDDYINKKYPDIKDKCKIEKICNKFEDGTVVTVTINEEIEGITTKKNPNKIYITVQFKVSDPNKFNFNGNLKTSHDFNLEFDKGKKISDLLTKIKESLGNKDLKDGYKIESNNSVIDNETELDNNKVYVITLDDEDPNFVEKIPEKETPEEHKDNKGDDKKDGEENDDEGDGEGEGEGEGKEGEGEGEGEGNKGGKGNKGNEQQTQQTQQTPTTQTKNGCSGKKEEVIDDKKKKKCC